MRILSYLTYIIRDYFPNLVYILDARFLNILKPIDYKFINIYYKRLWGNKESVSGPGSSLRQTSTIRKEIPILIKDLNIKSILDAPCGDFNWMSKVELNIDKYFGCDIVPQIIERNKKKYEDGIKKFKVLDITKNKLPKVDLILCRDCLVHLSNKRIFYTLRNFKLSKSKYLLTTIFTNTSKNRNIFTGSWRPINLQLKPFYFSKPIKLINENYAQNNNKYSDKSLGLWELRAIQI